MLKSLQNLVIRKMGSVGQSISGAAPAYEGLLDLVSGAVDVLDQYAPSADYLGDPYATIDGVVKTYDAVTGLNNGVAGDVETYSGSPVASSQATEALQPEWIANQFGTVPGITFDVVAQQYLSTSSAVTLASGAYTVVLVLKIPATFTNAIIPVCGFTDSGEIFNVYFDNVLQFYCLASSDDQTLTEASFTTPDPLDIAGDNVIIVAAWDDTTSVLRVNGAVIPTVDTGFGPVGSISKPMKTGAYSNAGSPAFEGVMGVKYIYDGILTTPQIESLETLLSTRYGITI